MSRNGNLVWHRGQVSRSERERLLHQTASTLWLTGLSAAGKSTLAFALEKTLTDLGRACFVLDGDNIRHGLNKDLDFSIEARVENIRRIAEVAKLMNEAGLIVITAFISPFVEDREGARYIIGRDSFREVYISTPLRICEARDPKGLYAKARKGYISEFTGLSSPYEPPTHPDLILDTSEVPFETSLARLVELALATPAKHLQAATA
ncbi:adenylyl-sulfate kinase [Pseudomonas sp. LTJR-52]|uniref:adenylyl-sulfate kinase n=1 Tax=Pseudomonas sp. LTJR-52 TaxID=2479392 RepID=UPI000EFA8746|nr:adenylyl-sulfate kinase [Pseudomonas sp. LTJR-52]AYN92948.1 adenylyl-sulfate kinase [Pseudomonas sp. LTJR-52]